MLTLPCLQRSLDAALQVVPIEDDYVIGKELGRGRFSVVCECVHKVGAVAV
jgi:hypothetical protein